MALTLATVYVSSIALLFRCFSKERLIWACFNHISDISEYLFDFIALCKNHSAFLF